MLLTASLARIRDHIAGISEIAECRTATGGVQRTYVLWKSIWL